MSDPHSLKPEKPGGCFTILGWVVVAALLSFVFTLLIFWRMSAEVTGEARKMAADIAAAFDRALKFTPEVRVDSVVVIAASNPVLQLVTVEKQALVRYRWTQTWLHSTKNLEVEATFTARAGFDLKEPFRIRIDPRSRAVGADLPPPRLLSLGMSDVRILRDEDGLWNKLTAADREQAFAALEEKARKEFAASNLLAEARYEGEKRIRELLKGTGNPRVTISPPHTPTP